DGGIEAADAERDPKVSATWFMRNCYHRPCDQADLPIEYGDAARLARLSAALARGIGDADARPAWNAGDFFGERFGGMQDAAGASPGGDREAGRGDGDPGRRATR